MRKNIGESMLDNLRAKIEDTERNTRIGRIDLNLTDYEMLNDSTARVMIEYTAQRGVPRQAQVKDWIGSVLEGQFRLALASVKNFQDQNVVTAVIQHNVDPHPMWYADKMMKLGANRYMDDEKAIWEIRHNDDGETFLARSQGEDITAILEERVRRQRVAFTVRPTLEAIREAEYSKLDTGDEVRYLDPSGMQQLGKITSVGQDTVKINSQTVEKSMVIDIEKKSPAAEKKEDNALNKIFKQMYGKEIADGLTKQ